MKRLAFLALTGILGFGSAAVYADNVSSLGRIEPAGGVVSLGAPSGASGVIAILNVEEGDWVEKDQVIAIMDDHALRKAEVGRIQAELENSERGFSRESRLSASSAISKAKLDDAELAVKINKARLAGAKARVELSVIRAPLSGQVLQIHSQPGERIGPEGVLELGQTRRMYAVAEVYETDIGRVKTGQKARISSPALAEPLNGVVETIGLKVGKMDILGTDPVAKSDARVIEVDILLDAGETVANLTNLQVTVEIMP